MVNGWADLKAKDIDVKEPSELLQITYNTLCVSKFGQVLTPSNCKEPPHLYWRNDPNKLYTMVMMDPDAPSRATQTMKNWIHWVVVNIPGSNKFKLIHQHFNSLGFQK